MPIAPAIALIALLGAPSAPGESPKAGADTVTVSLEEAVEIALVRSYALRNAKLDLEDAQKLTDASYSEVWPQLNANASYTRNIVVPNPFAGSSAGGFFDGFGSIGWLAYNEQVRVDNAAGVGDPAYVPRREVTLQEYIDADGAGQTAAGIAPGSANANPFFVPNSFNFGLSLSQVLYDGAAFSGIEASDKFLESSKVGVDRVALTVVSATAQSFYGALLAQEQASILDKSVERARATVEETQKRVSQGVLPRFALLSAEVELANLETQRLRSKNIAEDALDGLKNTLGLPAHRPIALRGSLELPEQPPEGLASIDEALESANLTRPDLRQAKLQVQLLKLQEDVTWAQYLPVLRAIANLGAIGNVPDDRDFLVPTGTNQEQAINVTLPDGTTQQQRALSQIGYAQQSEGFFSGSYWNASFNVGLVLSWNIFNGFRTTSTLERNQVSTNRARLQLEQLENVVRMEVEQARRDLLTAREQITTQARNIERAELNYRHAELRVKEGVSTQLELREASNQLDQSRFAHRQAIHDYLVARVRYDVALGVPPVTTKETP